MNINDINAKASAKITALSISNLVALFEKSENVAGGSIVRGWIMDELERRDPENFNAWIDCDDFTKGPREFFKAA